MSEEKTESETISRMEEATRKLEAASKKFDDSRLKAEEAKANAILGGHAEAGVPPVKETEEERVKREVKTWFPPDLLPDSLR